MLDKMKNTPSIIANDLDINGDLISLGSVEIEGKVTGKIQALEVTIRESGFVDGEVKTEVLNVKGNFKGTIFAKKVNVSGKAKINASLSYENLCVEDGAILEGEIKRVDGKEINKNIEKTEKSSL